MDLKLEGRVALVCASSAGIGRAIAEGLSREGAHVSIFARKAASLEAAAQAIEKVAKGKVLSQVADLSQEADLQRVVEQTQSALGPIDILINNQGGPAPGTLDSLTSEQLDSAIQTNLRSVVKLMKLCLPPMKARRFGRVINVLSISGKEPLPGMLLSNMMRPAILGLAKTLATEVAPFGVTINSLLPSAVLTQRTNDLLTQRSTDTGVVFAEVLAGAAKSLPIGYLASPEEFAQIALFLCSPKASYVSGTAIPVDGSFSRGLI